jgi:phosphatidylethanolamine-binding protein (PEBP) family uncharacterized protein
MSLRQSISMTRKPFLLIAGLALLGPASSLPAHDLIPTDPIAREQLRVRIGKEWFERQGGTVAIRPVPAQKLPLEVAAGGGAEVDLSKAPAQTKPFQAFLPAVKLTWDTDYFYVGSNGLPAHPMMVGITAWQQQVPLPQAYSGENSWRIPLHPKAAAEPAMVDGRFLRGAIALAVNGIPIFNPQNNRGEISYEIGELDKWGGHCGRADDYHYHIVPMHLQAIVGDGQPLAYALDGYPIYGLTEPDGSKPKDLDECHGHEVAGMGYHYHAAMEPPYVIGGFHGEVVEAEGQVDPQPRANPVREALQPLRGAEITGFEKTGENRYELAYEVNGDAHFVRYSVEADGTFPFEFDDGAAGKTTEVYTARPGGGGGPGGGGPGKGGKGKGGKGGKGMRGEDAPPPRPEEDEPREPRPQASEGILDLNGDGAVSGQEFANHAKGQFAKSGGGGTMADAMAKARALFQEKDRDSSGTLEAAEWQAEGSPAPRTEERGQGQTMAGPRREGGPGGSPGGGVPPAAADQPRSSDGTFLLASPVVEDGTEMPTDYSGDGRGVSPPLEWKGTPSGTREYALIMDHTDREGARKWYWTIYDIPGDANSLPEAAEGIGITGTGFKGEIGYVAPHSQGPGAKTYTITLYALSAPLEISQSPGEVDREVLIAAMEGKVLASSSLRVVHTSGGSAGGDSERMQPGPEPRGNEPERRGPGTTGAQDGPPPRPEGGSGGPGGGKGGPGGKEGKGGGKGQDGLVKPGLDDTMKLNVYADNWFMLYVNGRLVAVDSIQFTPHNVVSVDFLPEYPMTIAVLAKDNADPKTGMEYGTNIGDGGFVLKFADGTVTDASWKAKNFFHGPVDRDTANPRVEQEELPANWWAVDFDDSGWANAKEYTVEEVDPKQPYFDNDFEGAKFIWTDDLALDNTILLRKTVEKPGWTPRWNTRPDLDVTGVPQR